MKRVLCPELPRPGRTVPLPEGEADHALRVLRLRDGDVIEALDGHGHAARVTLRVRGTDGARLEHLAEVSEAPAEIPPVTLEMAILKGEAMEWVVEKAVELGVRRLIPTVTAHTVVQIRAKGPEAFRDRWQKIADQALKQCGRLDQLEVALPIELERLLASEPAAAEAPRLWLDEAARESVTPLHDWLAARGKAAGVRLLVGPEGGWSALERGMLAGVERVSLGPWVLRGETAAVLAAGMAAMSYRSRAAMQLDKTALRKGT